MMSGRPDLGGTDAYVIKNKVPRAPSGARGGVVAWGVLLAAALALATAGFADATTVGGLTTPPTRGGTSSSTTTRTPTKVPTKVHMLAPSSPRLVPQRLPHRHTTES